MVENIEHDFPELEANDFVTSWDDEDFVGCGNFSSARKCNHSDLGEVVIKCFCTSTSNGIAKSLKNGLHEAKILAQLEHKHVVQFYGITRWSDCIGCVMEVVENGSLEDLLMDKSIDEILWSLRVQLLENLSSGLTYIHSKNICHGDLKTENVLLTRGFSVKLADFGAAEMYKENINISLNGNQDKQYTAKYSAPEFLKNCNQRKTSSMDMYSYGLIAYETITRTTAFVEVPLNFFENQIVERRLKPEMKHVEEIAKFLENSDSEIFFVLKKFMLSCLDYNPTNRPSAGTVYSSLKNLLNHCNKAKLVFGIRKLALRKQRKIEKRSNSLKTRLPSFSPPFRAAESPEQLSPTVDSFQKIQPYKLILKTNSLDLIYSYDKQGCNNEKIKKIFKVELRSLELRLKERSSTTYLDPRTLKNLVSIKQEVTKNCNNEDDHGRKVAEVLCSLSVGRHFYDCLESLSDGFKNYPTLNNTEHRCFEEVREIIRISAKSYSGFCVEIVTSGLLLAFRNDLISLMKILNQKPDIYGYYAIQAMEVIERCAEFPTTLQQVEKLEIVGTLKWYCQNTYNIKIRDDLTLCIRSIHILFLLHKSNKFSLRKPVLEHCVQLFMESIKTGLLFPGNIETLTIIQLLEYLSKNKFNCEKMAHCNDLIDIIGQFLLTDTRYWHQVHCFNLLQNLVGLNQSRKRIASSPTIMEALTKIKSESLLLSNHAVELIQKLQMAT